MKIIGHRGASSAFPENTKLSILKAHEWQADGAEFDLQLLEDDLIVLHDDTLERTGTFPEGHPFPPTTPVRHLKFLDIQGVDVGAKFGHPGEKIVSLDEILKSKPAGFHYFIEIKGEFDPLAIKLLKNSLLKNALTAPTSEITLISFNLRLLALVKAELPKYPCLYLVEFTNNPAMQKMQSFEKLLRKIKHSRLDGIDIEASLALPAEYFEKIRQLNLTSATWVYHQDTPELYHHLKQIGVDYHTTNLPPEVLQAMEVNRT